MAPHVLAALLHRHGEVGDCEDAAQEAAEAARQRELDGVPDNVGAELPAQDRELAAWREDLDVLLTAGIQGIKRIWSHEQRDSR
ncbi:hypothetical protein [Lentzea sp. NPDC055074]